MATAIQDRVSSVSTKSPMSVAPRGWWAALRRTWSQASEDNIGLIAAGVGFYGFLALVPLLGAIVLSYGLVATPETVVENMQLLTKTLPADAAKLIGEQLSSVVHTSGGKKGLGLLLALALALYGAMKGAGAIVTALNIAYEVKESRGFVRTNLLALAITGAAVVFAVVAMIAVAAFGHLQTLLPFSSPILVVVGKVGSYLVLLAAAAAGAATLYRFGPDRPDAPWVWLTPGSVAFALGWVVLTLAFGIYAAGLGNYGATYGSLGAVVVLLTWLYLSAYVLLLGAEFNSEIERQAATGGDTAIVSEKS